MQKYFTFSGRATRSEFWWWQLFCLLVNVLPFVIVIALGGADSTLVRWLASAAYVFALAMIIPDLAVSSRRLHDIRRSGWWQLLFLVPIFGWALFVWWGVKLGDLGPNRFGPCPLPPSARLD